MSERPGHLPATQALEALGELYHSLEREVAALNPRCELRGRCCDFPVSGLTLYATEIEVEYLKLRHPRGRQPAAHWCPHYVGGRCEAREGRPLGCRLYFCDPDRQSDLEQLSMRYHQELKRLHRAHDIPYRYAPFLMQVRSATPPDR